MRHKSPAFQWYPDKALTDTRRLSWTAKGIYRELLDIIWMQFQRNCTIPDDDTFIASELGCDMDLWLSAKKEIMNEYRPLFKKTPQGLLSNGLKKEAQKQKEWREKSRVGGLKSANARKQRVNSPKGGSRVVDDCLQPNGNSLSLSPSPSPTPIPKDNIVRAKKNVCKRREYSSSFETFWKIYPRKTAKGAAYDSWQKMGCENDSEKIIASIEAQSRTVFAGTEMRFIPLCQTWLNQERWGDEAVGDVLAPQKKVKSLNQITDEAIRAAEMDDLNYK